MKKSLFLLLFVIALLILSCGKDSSPTSDKSAALKVTGTVTDKNGAGINGVNVQITGTNFNSTDTTDAYGVFEFKGIPSGSYTIQTSAETRVFKPSKIETYVSDSDINTVKFTAAENRIHGQVFDIITNRGIPGIKLSFGGKNTSFEDSVTTDSKGEYEFFDLPQDDYSISNNSNILEMYQTSQPSPIWINFTIDESTFPDINLPSFYMSSEVLRITTATYSKETNTVHLEWTQSKSNFCKDYHIVRTDKLPFGSSDVEVDLSRTNDAFIEITPKYRAPINNAKIIHFSVYASYLVSTAPYIRGIYSEPVSIQVAE